MSTQSSSSMSTQSSPATTLATFLAFRNASSPLRRGLSGGLVAGGVITFLIVIGIPGGASDSDGLPAWFAWALFLLAALALGYSTARPRSVPEQRAQKPVPSLASGLIVGLAAAVVVVSVMVGINAAQLWEINLPRERAVLPTGLKSNITRVQDVLANVTPRSTAVLSGLPLDAIKPPDGQTRADPTGGFVKMALLLLVAAALGGGLSWFNTQISLRREYRRENASKMGQMPPARNWVRWLPIALPVLFFVFLVFNAAPPAGAIGADYRNLIGNSGQLLGLLAAFFTVGAGLVGVRSAVGERDNYAFAIKAGVLILITVTFFIIGLAAPARPAGDLLFSQKSANLTQSAGADGKIQVITEAVTPVDTDALLNYRRLAIGLIGLCMLIGNILGARSKTPLRSLIATDIMLCTLLVGPLYLDKYQQSVLLLVGINALLGMGLNIVVGYVGLLDLGYVSFFAIGAYTFAFITSNQDIRAAGTVIGLKYGGNDQLAQGMSAALIIGLFLVPLVVIGGLSLWKRAASSRKPAANPAAANPGARPAWLGYALVAAAVIVCQVALGLLQGTPFYNSFSGFPVFIIGLLLSIIVAAVGGMLLGIPVLRLRGDYLAIVTLGFGEITRLVFNNLRTITGGPQGIITIPRVGFTNLEMGSNEGLLYLVLICCLFVAFLLLRLKASRQGRAWGAVRAEEDIAQAMGINPFRAKVLGYALGAVMAAVGGVIFAIRQGSIFPDNFTLSISVNVLCLVIIGGMGSLPGVVVGALVLIGVPESLRVFESYRVMAFGVLLIVMMLLRPQGILPQPPQPLARRAQELAAAGKEQS